MIIPRTFNGFLIPLTFNGFLEFLFLGVMSGLSLVFNHYLFCYS
jgi:hypothetical protein